MFSYDFTIIDDMECFMCDLMTGVSKNDACKALIQAAGNCGGPFERGALWVIFMLITMFCYNANWSIAMLWVRAIGYIDVFQI